MHSNLYQKKTVIVTCHTGFKNTSFYPILADLGFFGMEQLAMVGKPGGILADIPDCSIPGYER